MRLPKVSIVIPTYNAVQYIGAAIESVLHQSFEDFEILVVDDASSDDTRDFLANRFHSIWSSRLRYLRNDVNKERSFSRNRGVGEAQGEYVAFLDADDIWLSHHLELLVGALVQRAEFSMAFSLPLFVDRDGNKIRGMHKRELTPREARDPLRAFLLGKAPFPSGLVIRKEIYEEIGGFNESLELREDWEFGVRVGLHSSVQYLRALTFLYRSPTDKLTINERWLRSTLKAGELIISYLDEQSQRALVHISMAEQCLAGWRIDSQWFQFGRGYLWRAIQLAPAQLPKESMYLLLKAMLPLSAVRKLSRLKQSVHSLVRI